MENIKQEYRLIRPNKKKGNSAKRNFVVVAGGDNRGWCLKRTLPRICPYFDKVYVIDMGSTDDTREICKKNNVTIVNSLERDIVSLAWPIVLDEIPPNEWVYYCDSDECPSQILLSSLDYMQKKGNQLGVTNYCFPSCHHHHYADGSLGGAATVYAKGNRFFHADDSHFTKIQFIKNTPGTYISHRETHYRILSGGPELYMPYPYNHYKGDKSIAQSFFILGLGAPNTHHFSKGTSAEADDWHQLVKEIGPLTPKDLAEWSGKKNSPEKCLELWDTWKDSTDKNAVKVYKHVFEYDYDSVEPLCTNTCCHYEH